MNVLSIKYLVFIAILLFLYYTFFCKLQWIILLTFSLAFYCTYGYKGLGFILITSVTIWMGAIFIEKYLDKKKLILVIILLINIGLLLDLKYADFFIGFIELAGVNVSTSLNLLDCFKIGLPLGISFYTLSAVGYFVDIYKGKYEVERNYFKFLLYISYFPHILQGPIARYDKLGKQFNEKHIFDYRKITLGMQLMLWGFFKKMVIADRLSIFVDSVYGSYNIAGGTELLLASLLYTFQIYADFSGCVDIARGTSELFGIELMNNFDSPYLAVSINDFWKRWHISLSSWFRDYLYIPLGGNRKGTVRRWGNVMIVFLVSGFWHGVGLHYIFWGMLHGLYQVIGYIIKPLKNSITNKLKIDIDRPSYHLFKMFITFLLVSFAWIFFRVEKMEKGLIIVKEIICSQTPWTLFDRTIYNYGIDEKDFFVIFIALLIVVIVDVLHNKKVSVRNWISEQNIFFRWIIYYVAMFVVIIFAEYGLGFNSSSFIYMNF